MSKFHNGPNGPGPCGANNGRCPFGGESGSDNHFDNMKDAENAFAKAQGGTTPPPLKKPKFHHRPKSPVLKPQYSTGEKYASKADALKAYAEARGGKKTEASAPEIKNELSSMINSSDLETSHGGVSGMSEKLSEAIKSNPAIKNELNNMVKDAGYDSDKYHVSGIMSRDSLDGGNLYNMVNFQAQELDSENYDWDAHDDGEEEDLEQTEAYYNKMLNGDFKDMSANVAEVNYNGGKYTVFLSDDKEERNEIYGS